MNEKYRKKLWDAILYTMDYDGLWEYLLWIKEALLTEQDRNGYVTRPKFMSEYDIDHVTKKFWSVLVLMFGNYGTAPRCGWIEKENINEAIEFIDDILNAYKRHLPPWLKDLNEESYNDYIEAGLFTEDEEIGQDYLKGDDE